MSSFREINAEGSSQEGAWRRIAAQIRRMAWHYWHMVKFFVLASLFKEPLDLGASFEAVYALKGDPWRYEISRYEQEKYRDTIANLPPCSRVLEVGCAEGAFTQMLAQRAEDVTGVDISPTAVLRARKKCLKFENIRFLHLDIEFGELPFASFDLIVCSEVLYYLDDPGRIRKVGHKLTEHLEPGGHLVLVDRRIRSDGTSGFPAPLFRYPSMGAATVHRVLASLPNLKKIREIKRSFYTITVLRKGKSRE